MPEDGSACSTGLPVFLVTALPEGERTVLTGEEGRHAVTVRRIRLGERLVISDGAGAMARCVTESVRSGRAPEVDLLVEHRWVEPRPALRVTIAQALVKGERGELAVELATEAGADAIVPWQAARSVARWDDSTRGQKGLLRWRRTARSAAKQARRGWLPEVREPVDTSSLVELVGSCAGAVLLDSAAAVAFAELSLPADGELVVVVGPEGGINETEFSRLTAAGAVPTRLGPTVLRASTAAAVTLGALGARSGRWS